MRVRGVENLRVCDLSAVPNNNFGNTAINRDAILKDFIKKLEVFNT